ncbi:hypothetical protein GCM10023215_67230 [Pseudonocardia yuanmonensis]|uniref:Metal-binding protein n=1 Tax=Pseudonocardia yuanmonensis TaxID=1095914 RepID=A0ABP8XVV2_9PSEU
MPLLICRTCPRYDTANNGRFSHTLTEALQDHPARDEIQLRYVQCLGGCPDDGVAAVDAPGKARVRFTGLDAADTAHAEALIKAAHAHHECATGAPDDWEIPAELQERISSVTFKRQPRSAGPWG